MPRFAHLLTATLLAAVLGLAACGQGEQSAKTAATAGRIARIDVTDNRSDGREGGRDAHAGEKVGQR